MLIFGADLSTSIHVDNKKKYILAPERGTTQGLERFLKLYSINFTVPKKFFFKFAL